MEDRGRNQFLCHRPFECQLDSTDAMVDHSAGRALGRPCAARTAFRALGPNSAAGVLPVQVPERFQSDSHVGQFRRGLSETGKGKDEIHLAFTRQGLPPIKWAWWRNGEETFDVPLLLSPVKTAGLPPRLGFPEGVRVTGNTGDERACFHLFPQFGTLRPDERDARGSFLLPHGRSRCCPYAVSPRLSAKKVNIVTDFRQLP